MPPVLVVVGVFASIRVDREVTLFRQDARRDQRVIATTLAHAVEVVWARQGANAAVDMIRDSDAARSELRIRWVVLDDSVERETRPMLAPDHLRALEGDAPLQDVVVPGPMWAGPEDALVTYAPVRVGGHRYGALEVSESLAPASGYLRQTVRNTLLLSLALVLVCVAVTWLLGEYLITRPVADLIARARAIGASRTPPLAAQVQPPAPQETALSRARRDELGDLSLALAAAAQELSEATDRAHAEEEARLAAQEQLRHAERLATAGKLASVLAHEIGTPLNVASGHAQLMASRLIESDKVVESAQIIKGQCDRIAQLVRQLLDFATRRPPKLAVTDLGDLARVTVDLLGHLAKRHSLELVFQGADEGVTRARVDAFQAQQALTNLVMNAIHATPPDNQIVVSVSRRDVSGARGSQPEPGPYVITSVADRGPGVAAGEIDRIFEPFFTTKAPGEGTGLGLSITRDILREHGGWVSVTPRPEGGALFELFWPASFEPQ